MLSTGKCFSEKVWKKKRLSWNHFSCFVGAAKSNYYDKNIL